MELKSATLVECTIPLTAANMRPPGEEATWLMWAPRSSLKALLLKAARTGLVELIDANFATKIAHDNRIGRERQCLDDVGLRDRALQRAGRNIEQRDILVPTARH